ncbi:MAG: elongation factor P [Myxococcota bacterium]
MYSTSDFKRGLRIMYEGSPHSIIEFQHHKPGKGAAIVRTRLRNLLTGNVVDPTFRSGDKVDRPDLEDKEVQFLYAAEEVYHFMEPASFEQYEITKDTLGEATHFLVDGITCSVLFYRGKPINIDLPNHVILTVVECDPAVRGDTVQGATKPARMQTGYTVQVPLFINEGDNLKIDTRTGEYTERA